MSASPVVVQRTARRWRLRLNRPQHGNACSAELVRHLDEALADAADHQAEVVVLEGDGRHFCTGFDLSNLERENDDSLLARFVRVELLLQRIARAPFLTVARAHGKTMGAGADLFAACAVRLADPGASFAFPGARGFGLVLGTRRLARHVGVQAAFEWVQSGRTVGAQEACDRGLASGLVDGARPVEDLLLAPANDAWLAGALRRAMDCHAEADDARDLDLLVRSAARPGLRERIARYVDGLAAARQARNICPPAE